MWHDVSALVAQPRSSQLDPLGPGATLRRLDEAADEYVETQRPRSTRAAYAQDWAVWEDYTRWAGIPVLAGTRGALVGFVLWLEHGSPGRRSGPAAERGAAPSTIRRRLAGVMHGLRQHSAQIDPAAQRAANAALEGYRRRLAAAGEVRGRGQAHPVTVRDVLAMSRACPPTVAGLRDRALLTIGFYAAARASDLAQLTTSDITVERNGLVVIVRVGKTTGESALSGKQHPFLCPRAAWLRWRDAAQLHDGPAFRAVGPGHTPDVRPLSPDAVTRIVSRAGERAGLPYPITCHSLRAGFATASYAAGHNLLRIARQGRWVDNSAELLGYIREISRWENNPTDGLDVDPEDSGSA
jgi:integrase